MGEINSFAGMLWPYVSRLPLGKLPLDIRIKLGNAQFYTNGILNFIELCINYTFEVFEVKKLLSILALLLLKGCTFYAGQSIGGDQVLKSTSPSVKFNMTVSQGVKIKK